MSDKKISFKVILDIVDNDEMWKRYDKIKNVKKGKLVAVEDLKFCMASILAAIKIKCMQRPAAMCNCTIDEYSKAVIEDGVTVIRVKDHKTGAPGTARLLCSGYWQLDCNNIMNLLGLN